MFEGRSLKWPVTLGVTMIVLIVALTVGWIVLAVTQLASGRGAAPLYWTLLTVGTLFLVLVLGGVIAYLALTVKAVNLHRRQSNFIDSVTHELKSPIASLKLYLQTLNRHNVPSEQREQFLRDMLEDVERLDRLINNLLEVARLDRRPVADDQEEVELGALLEYVADEVRTRYRAAPETLQLELATAQAHATRADLEIIFRNLIDNAYKYAGDPPLVEVAMRRLPGQWLAVTVSDNGRGIPLHLRRKIFGRFIRLGVELVRDKPGTGLGLYLVDSLVRRLHGRIRVRDRAAGPGVVFEIQLPLTDSAEPESPPARVTHTGAPV